MDKPLVKNGIIKKLDTDTEYLYSFYGLDLNKKYNILFVVTDRSLFLWEDVGNNLKIRVKQYKNINKINFVDNTLYITFKDENFALKQLNKEDGEIKIFYRFVNDFYNKALNQIVEGAMDRRNAQKPQNPNMQNQQMNDRRNRNQPPMQNRGQQQNQPQDPRLLDEDGPISRAEQQDKRLASLAMFSTDKSTLGQVRHQPIEEYQDNMENRDSQIPQNRNNRRNNKDNFSNINDRNNQENTNNRKEKKNRNTNNKNNKDNKSNKNKKSKGPIIVGIIGIIIFIAAIGLALYFLVFKNMISKKDTTVDNKTIKVSTDKKKDNTDTSSKNKGRKTKTQKEAETKLNDLDNLKTVSDKNKVIYAKINTAYESYKDNPNEFDFDAAILDIDNTSKEYEEIGTSKIKLKSKIKGNVDGNYIYEELKKNEKSIDDLISNYKLNLQNKFSDNGRTVEFETLLSNVMASNQTVGSLIKDEIDLFTKELESYGVGSIGDEDNDSSDDDEITVENNEEMINNAIGE